jgi:hypothetical protein
MVCCPVEEHCCTQSNISIPTRSHSPISSNSNTINITENYIPTGQLIVKEYSQKIGVTTFVMSIMGTAATVSILLVLAFARYHEHEARNIFLDSLYG